MGPLVAAVLVHAPTSSASSTDRLTPSGVRKRPTAIRGFCAASRPFAISLAVVVSMVGELRRLIGRNLYVRGVSFLDLRAQHHERRAPWAA